MTAMTEGEVKALVKYLRNPWREADNVERGPLPAWEAALLLQAANCLEDTAQQLADAQAAVALVVEKADFEVQGVSDNCETDGERLAIMSAVDRVRALAPEDAIAEVAKLRAERDMWTETARLHLNAEQAFLAWLREAGEHMRAEGVTVCDDGVDSGDILAAKVAECAALLKAERDRLAAELAAANAREAGLRPALRHYMDLAHSGGTEADWHEAHDGATAAMEGCSK